MCRTSIGGFQTTFSQELVGELKLNVIQDLIAEGFPCYKWYTMKKDGKNTVKLQLSFNKIEAEVSQDSSPLLQQALIQAQYDAQAKGEELQIDLVTMSEKEKLLFFSRVLEGPLKMMHGMGAWKAVYLKPLEVQPNRWEWCYWDNKQACYAGEKRRGSIAFLGISTVLPDANDRHQFYVKFYDSRGVHDVFFRRVDRDRNLWSDGLYEFIEKLRDFLSKYPSPDRLEEFALQKEKEAKAKAAKTAEIEGPRLRKAEEENLKEIPPLQPPSQPSSVPPTPRAAPASAAAMTKGLMYETEEFDEEKASLLRSSF